MENVLKRHCYHEGISYYAVIKKTTEIESISSSTECQVTVPRAVKTKGNLYDSVGAINYMEFDDFSQWLFLNHREKEGVFFTFV